MSFFVRFFARAHDKRRFHINPGGEKLEQIYMYPYHVIEYTTVGPSGVYFERLQDAIKMIMHDTYWYFAKIEDIRTGEIIFREERPYCILKGGMGKDAWNGEMFKTTVCFRTKAEVEAHAANIAAGRLKYELEIIELRDSGDYLDLDI